MTTSALFTPGTLADPLMREAILIEFMDEPERLVDWVSVLQANNRKEMVGCIGILGAALVMAGIEGRCDCEDETELLLSVAAGYGDELAATLVLLRATLGIERTRQVFMSGLMAYRSGKPAVPWQK